MMSSGTIFWKNSPDGLIYKYDVSIAKNYLNESELKKLNNLTNLFLDYVEDMTEEENIMTMQDWVDTTDKLLKFRVKQDREYISSMDEMYKKYLEREDNQ